MKLTLTKIKTLPIGKKISDGQGLCLTKTAPNKGRWEHRYMINKRARHGAWHLPRNTSG